MAKRRRTEIAFIANPASRLVTYSKRRKGLFNKASELCRLCSARAAVVVFSPTGKPCSFGYPSADDIVADYLRVGDGDAMPPMDLTEWEQWVDTELDACATEEELEYFIWKYEAVCNCVRQKLKALEEEEEDAQVKVSGGAGDSQVLTEEEIDPIFERSSRCPARPDLSTDGDQDGVMTSPENRAASGGSSAMESNPARSDLEGCGANATGGGSLGMAWTPTCSDLEHCGFDPDEFLTLLADGDGFLNSPEDSAVSGGNSGVEATLSDQEGYGCYDPNDFVDLEDLDVQL
ncbi:MADS-box transcription factor 50-like [Rhodamnia argentea]|uniref:MADS-box transcription factor 50-like n=1 Tax=Rhodamnia argentea TaxID=178133 RepID=A0A8B8Q110_9MYRT|nr:MADS-box transcription factor 50-like [Rhodamnia argentea]